MVPRHFVVRDYFVIPVHDVETAVRAGAQCDRAEPFVAGKHKVRQLLVTEARSVRRDLDRLNLPRDRIREVELPGVGSGPDATRSSRREEALITLLNLSLVNSAATGIGKRQPAQPRPAHRKLRCRPWKFRRVALPRAARAARIIRVFVKRHHRIAEVVRLLNPRLPVTIEHEAPDVARALRRDVEVAAVIAELRHARLVELLLLARRGLHLAVVERALRKPNPVARRARELVRKQM